VILVATAALLLALPFLLWPLLRPPEAANAAPNQVDEQDELRRQVEEVQLDLASGRLDRAEAERRLAELAGERG
jgi:cytochrome c-type biogenesis protein CcmI